jgi:uncharacterized protein (TIGR02302 family)
MTKPAPAPPILRTQWVMAAERLGPVLFWPCVIAMAFCAYAWIGLADLLPPWLGALILLVALGGAVWTGRDLPKTLKVPNRAMVLARIEADSHLIHRPLTTLEDQLGAGDSALWAAHLARARKSITGFVLKPPAPSAAKQDPYALRALSALLMVIGLVIAGPEAPERFDRAIAFRLWAKPAPPNLEAWIEPPKSTLRPPVFLTRLKPDEAVSPVPEDSELLVKIRGARHVAVEFGKAKQVATGKREDTQELKINLTQDGVVEISADGEELLRRKITVLPRIGPKLVWLAKPEPTRRASLRLAYRAYDRYGMADMAMTITRQDGGSDDIDLPAPLHSAAPDSANPIAAKPGAPSHEMDQKPGDQIIFRDLTSHPWAGLDVALQLHGKNLEGLEGTSEAQVITLPEREFHHPIARRIIAERKTLARDPALSLRVARALGSLLEKPSAFGDDFTVYLSLRASMRRLIEADGRLPDGIFDLLWSTALRVEDGQTADAAKALREVQERLEKALAENRPQAEIDQLMSDLRKALGDYIREMANNPKNRSQAAPPPGSKTISPQDLKSLMDKAQDLSRSGNRDAARQLLSMLQSLLENLGSAQGQGAPSPGDEAANEAMGKLGDLMGKQQRLMDQTMREGQKGPRGSSPDGQAQPGMDPGIAAQQKALRKELNDIVEGLGEAGDLPDALGQADDAMRRAEQALGAKRPQDAETPQGEALNALRESAKALGKKIMENMAKNGQGRGKKPGGPDDPLGRPDATDQPGDGAGIRVPDEPDIARAREIMDELRKRASDRQRPKTELDYLDRLLEQF